MANKMGRGTIATVAVAGAAAVALAVATLGGPSTAGSADAGGDAAQGQEAASTVITEPIRNGYESGTHHARIEVRGYGTISVELDADTAPITVSNFAQLASDGFYDGLTFHRIMQGFMIQGGDPNGDGTGGAAQDIKGEFSDNGVENGISHERGTISMARSGASMDSASSQFFICDEDDAFLDGQYAAFGHVTDGMAVVDKIAADAEPIDGNGTIPAEAQPVIESIEMVD